MLDISRAAARARIRSKPEPGPINRELMDAPLTGAPWQNAERAYFAVLDLLGEHHTSSIIRVDVTDSDIAESCNKIMELIEHGGNTNCGGTRGLSFPISGIAREW